MTYEVAKSGGSFVPVGRIVNPQAVHIAPREAPDECKAGCSAIENGGFMGIQWRFLRVVSWWIDRIQ